MVVVGGGGGAVVVVGAAVVVVTGLAVVVVAFGTVVVGWCATVELVDAAAAAVVVVELPASFFLLPAAPAIPAITRKATTAPTIHGHFFLDFDWAGAAGFGSYGGGALVISVPPVPYHSLRVAGGT